MTHSLANSSVARDALTEKLHSCTWHHDAAQSIPVPEPHQAAMLKVMAMMHQRTAPDTGTAWSRGQVVRKIRPSVRSSC